jgi:hypothetical protein
MSPSTRAVKSTTEISITSSSRSEIHQLPTSVYSNITEIASTQRQQYPQISSGTVEGANSSASVLPPKNQQSYPGNALHRFYYTNQKLSKLPHLYLKNDAK